MRSARNPERVRENQRAWRERNREKLAAQQRARRAADPDRVKAQNARYRSENPDGVRNSYLKYVYGITLDEYDRRLAAQGGACAICATSEPGNRKSTFCVDHDHRCCAGTRSCGRCIRGLLCSTCNNRILGGAKDDPEILRSAIRYLERG